MRKMISTCLLIVMFLNLSSVFGTIAASETSDDSTEAGVNIEMENPVKTAYPGTIWEPGEAKYTTVRQGYVPVVMDDGITLEAQVLYPADKASGEITEEKFPVVVEFTPYGGSPNQYLAEHGYISALVHMRGTYNSEGEVGLFSTRDVKDAENVVNWAAYDLEHSDGRVAFIGSSMPAGTALAAASGDNVSPLKAVIAANNSLDSVYKQCWAINGIPTTGFYNYTSYAPRMYGGTEAANRFFSQVRENIMSGGDMAYYGDFWQERLPLTFAEKINSNGVPVLMISGIEDIMDVPVMKTYTALQNAYAGRSIYAPMEAGQDVTPKYQVIMGKWGHGANLDMGLYLQWLETWVRGVDTGLQNTKKPLHLWEGGSDKWYNTDCYPITNQSSQWYLTDGGITTEAPAVVGSGELVYTYPHEEKGKLVFESEPLAGTVRIAGPISASVYASTTGSNLVLVADLFDEAPGGDRTHISRGVILGSMSEISAEKSWIDDNEVIIWPWQNLDKDIYLEADTVYKFDIPLGTRSWKFTEGHKLVIEVTTKSPIDVLPENGIPARNGSEPGYLTETQMETIVGQEFTVYYGGDYPSAVNLPVIPEDMFSYVDAEILPVIGQQRWGAYPIPLDWDN